MKISADPQSVKATGDRLGHFADGCESVASRVRPTDRGSMPPHVAAVVWGRLSNVHRDLQRGRNGLQEVSIETRRRAVMLEVAGNGGSAATRAELAAIARDGGKYGGMTLMGGAIGLGQAYSRFGSSFGTYTLRSITDLPGDFRFALQGVGQALKTQGTHLSRRWGQSSVVRNANRWAKNLDRAFAPVAAPLKAVLRPLNVVSNVKQIVSTYQQSSGPVWARLTETTVKSSGMLLTKNPIGYGLDIVTGGAVRGAGELAWAATGVFGDTGKFDAYSDKALAGQFGGPTQQIARFGNWLGYDVIGGAIYGPDSGSGGGGGW